MLELEVEHSSSVTAVPHCLGAQTTSNKAACMRGKVYHKFASSRKRTDQKVVELVVR